MNDTVLELEDRIREMEKEAVRQQAYCDELIEKNKEYLCRKFELEHNLEDLYRERHELVEEIERLRECISDLQHKNQDLTEHCARLQEELQYAHKLLNQIRTIIDRHS